MKKIIEENQVEEISAQKKSINQTVVLAGGVFDILHEGHIHFLKTCKNYGDVLILLLESDENVKKTKGIDRPINDQSSRANVLSSLTYVDYIVNLKGVTNDGNYDKLIVQIKPDVIALTKGDPGIEKRRKQCEMIGAKLVEIEKADTASTTELIKKNG